MDEGGIGGVAMGATTMSPCRDPPRGPGRAEGPVKVNGFIPGADGQGFVPFSPFSNPPTHLHPKRSPLHHYSIHSIAVST